MYRKVMERIYSALCKKGYDPIHQLEDFLLSGDPTHITPYDNARILSGSIDRDVLLVEMLRYYLGISA